MFNIWKLKCFFFTCRWAVLCLGWHRDVRRNSPELMTHMSIGGNSCITANTSNGTLKTYRTYLYKTDNSITSSNLARFLAWGLPAFQTVAVIVARIIDADELLGKSQ